MEQSSKEEQGFGEVIADANSLPIKLGRNGLPLVPVPSDDPNDPLNFSTLRKTLISCTLAVWMFTGTSNIIVTSAALVPISTGLNEDFNNMTYLIGAPLLAYGVASLLWVAVGNRFGIRNTFLVSTLAAALLSLGGALSQTFSQLIVLRTLASAFCASPETLGPQIIADIFYLSERAFMVSFITIFQAGGFAFGSLIGAFATYNSGWRWTQWSMAILMFVSFALVFVFMPETQYTKHPSELTGHEKRTFLDDFKICRTSGGGRPKVHSFLAAFFYPFRYFPHPVVIIITVYFSFYLVIADYILTSQSLAYELVLGFTLPQVGRTSVAPLLGCLLSVFFSGYLNDVWIVRMRKKNGGTFIPEMRLPFFIVPCIFGTFGMIIFGVCVEEQRGWFPPLIGSFAVLFGFTSAYSLSYAYLIDIYLARADATLVIVNGFKNLAAFGISYAIIPWNTNAGYTVPFVVLGCLCFAFHLLILLLWWKGETIRAWSASRFVEARETHHGDHF